MRDNIFKLVTHDTCKGCGSPIDIRFYGSDAGYDLFCYWAGKNKLKYNKLFYTRAYGTSFVKTCKACWINRRNSTFKARRIQETTGKLPYSLKRAKTYDEITELWGEFKEKVKDSKWLIDAYIYLKWCGDSIMWHYYFNDIFKFFHSDVEFDFVYDLEEYEQYQC